LIDNLTLLLVEPRGTIKRFWDNGKCHNSENVCTSGVQLAAIHRACGVSSTLRLIDSIIGVSGILDHPHARVMTIARVARLKSSLRANGSRECAPDDRLREAIHFAVRRKNGLLRNDVAARVRPPAARCVRVVQERCPSKQRAQGKPGAQCTRSIACENKKAHDRRHHRFTGIPRPSLRNGFNGLYRALPGDRAFLPPSLAELPPPT
jgi:hypothetical protein